MVHTYSHRRRLSSSTRIPWTKVHAMRFQDCPGWEIYIFPGDHGWKQERNTNVYMGHDLCETLVSSLCSLQSHCNSVCIRVQAGWCASFYTHILAHAHETKDRHTHASRQLPEWSSLLSRCSSKIYRGLINETCRWDVHLHGTRNITPTTRTHTFADRRTEH